jgi:hypothetical protein
MFAQPERTNRVSKRVISLPGNAVLAQCSISIMEIRDRSRNF